MPDGRYISETDWPDVAAILRAWRAGEILRQSQPDGEGATPAMQSRLVCLLEDLNPGGSATAEILTRESSHLVQDVCLVGFPELASENGPAGTLTLQWDGGQLPDLHAFDSADTVYAKLLKSSLGPYLADVSLGRPEDQPLLRWRISLIPPPNAPDDWPGLSVQSHTLGTPGGIRIPVWPSFPIHIRRIEMPVQPGSATPLRVSVPSAIQPSSAVRTLSAR